MNHLTPSQGRVIESSVISGDSGIEWSVVPRMGSPVCAEDEERWRVILAPYLWAAALKGAATVRGVGAELDVSFSETLDALKYAVIGHAELQRGRFFLISDTVLLATETDASVEKSAPIGRSGEVVVNVDATLEQFTLIQELLAGYTLYECPVGALVWRTEF